ncbi:MAG: laminin G domain-containing protein [Candidatus Omnitrophica bacterium]|nr:laminin G domain-containing protein [Candidatus Omnitrophota bacterium]
MAVRYNGSETMKGFLAHGAVQNYLTYSEDFANAAWDAVGTGSGTAADAIVGSAAGDGVTQASASAADSNSYVGSVFLWTTSGTAVVRLLLKDEGSQWGFTDCPVTTVERRFQVPHAFLSGTGNVSMQILVGDTSTVRARGAQLEQITSGTGQRRQRAMASPYVKTTSAAASCGTGAYLIPNAIIADAATKGTIAFWFLTDLDFTDKTSQTGTTFFSSNFDLISLTSGMYNNWLQINNVIVAQTPTGLLHSAMKGPQADRWTHFAATWDADANIARIYLNGEEIAEGTDAFAPIVWGEYDLNIGAYVNGSTPYAQYAAEGAFGQVVMWKKALSAEEVLQTYQTKQAIAERPAPGTGLIFSVDLGTSPIPTVGDDEHWWGVTNNVPYYYYDTPTTAKATAINEYPAPSYALNGENVGGWRVAADATNLILQSEDPTTTWTQVGTPTAVIKDGASFGEISLGAIINNAANQGIQQSVAAAVASKSYQASVYVKAGAGTINGALIIEGDSGGTPETATQAFAATTTMQRVWVATTFTGAATGNIRMKIIITDAAASALLFGGMQLQLGLENTGVYNKNGSPYIKTTTTAKTIGHTQIHYRASDSFNVNKGTLVAWAYLEGGLGAVDWPGNGPSIIGAPGQFCEFYYHFGDGIQNRFEYGGVQGAAVGNADMTAGQWYHLAITWDKAAETYAVYQNGVLIDEGTEPSPYSLTYRKFIMGGDYMFAEMDYWQGSVKLFRIWGEAKDATFIDADFDSTKASYGY